MCGEVGGKDLERSYDVMQELKVQAVPCQKVEEWEANARSPEVPWCLTPKGEMTASRLVSEEK